MSNNSNYKFGDLSDECQSDHDDSTEAETPCSSSKSFYSETSEISPRLKKSVQFRKEAQVFLIPSRKDILSYFISPYWIYETDTKNFCNTKNTEPISNKPSKKSVTFYKVVSLYLVPCREDLKAIANDLWYETEEILTMQLEAQEMLLFTQNS